MMHPAAHQLDRTVTVVNHTIGLLVTALVTKRVGRRTMVESLDKAILELSTLRKLLVDGTGQR